MYHCQPHACLLAPRTHTRCPAAAPHIFLGAGAESRGAHLPDYDRKCVCTRTPACNLRQRTGASPLVSIVSGIGPAHDGNGPPKTRCCCCCSLPHRFPLRRQAVRWPGHLRPTHNESQSTALASSSTQKQGSTGEGERPSGPHHRPSQSRK